MNGLMRNRFLGVDKLSLLLSLSIKTTLFIYSIIYIILILSWIVYYLRVNSNRHQIVFRFSDVKLVYRMLGKDKCRDLILLSRHFRRW